MSQFRSWLIHLFEFEPAVRRRDVPVQLCVTQLEARDLMSVAPAAIFATFNAGVSSVRGSAGALVDRAFQVDVPVVKESFNDAVQLEQRLKDTLNVKITAADLAAKSGRH